MFAEVFSIIAPVFLCAVVGFGWAKKGTPFETAFVTRLVTNIGFPCLIFTALIKADITAEALGTMGLASLLSVVAFAAIAAPALKAIRLSQRTYLSSLILANTGNMGLPLSLLAFGEEGLARGVLIIECAMPAAVFNYLFAQAHNNRPDEVAGIVLVSTALSFMTLPTLLWFVK